MGEYNSLIRSAVLVISDPVKGDNGWAAVGLSTSTGAVQDIRSVAIFWKLLENLIICEECCHFRFQDVKEDEARWGQHKCWIRQAYLRYQSFGRR